LQPFPFVADLPHTDGSLIVLGAPTMARQLVWHSMLPVPQLLPGFEAIFSSNSPIHRHGESITYWYNTERDVNVLTIAIHDCRGSLWNPYRYTV
jgi:hypothetical protein